MAGITDDAEKVKVIKQIVNKPNKMCALWGRLGTAIGKRRTGLKDLWKQNNETGLREGKAQKKNRILAMFRSRPGKKEWEAKAITHMKEFRRAWTQKAQATPKTYGQLVVPSCQLLEALLKHAKITWFET